MNFTGTLTLDSDHHLPASQFSYIVFQDINFLCLCVFKAQEECVSRMQQELKAGAVSYALSVMA
jgi:hypothetical protein